MEKKLKKLLIFAGTTEGRKLSEYLAAAKIEHTICVATEYGKVVLNEHSLVNVHQGRLNQKEIEEFLKDGRITVVVDATHPFAKEITRNIKVVIEKMHSQGMEISYLRLKRDNIVQREDKITYFETNEACAKVLEGTKGNILLTVGAKELSKYCIFKDIKRRLYVRVLPSMESISVCTEQGICGKQIIAMQGPFRTEMNQAIIKQYNISYLVTKESGISGGYLEKLEAAKEIGIELFVIGRPKEEEGYSFSEICSKLEKIYGKRIERKDQMEIVLAGIGMGNKSCLTKEVEKAINEADILLGAERMLENFYPKLEKHSFYQAKQIIPYLQEVQRKNLFREDKKVVILFSGDSGFYSGCQGIYEALKREIQEERLIASVRILPGISSVAYLAACIGESYEDADIYSIHGKKMCNFVHKIKNSPKIFLLTSGIKDINWLGKLLLEADMSECEVITGYQLSYQEQWIRNYTPEECCKLEGEGLYTCLLKNPHAIKRKLTHGMRDETFIRDKVPMTKEEIREVSICKLRLNEWSIVYDIGSGTGSIAVEIAALSDTIQVYALEQKANAVSLIEKNKKKFCMQNIRIVEAMAPEALSELPAATHALIGGSSGKLKEILSSLKQINSKMRIVIHAISMETICEIKEILSRYKVKGEEVIQLQVSKAKKMGNYHLMQSENPVWICSFDFAED